MVRRCAARPRELVVIVVGLEAVDICQALAAAARFEAPFAALEVGLAVPSQVTAGLAAQTVQRYC